jgi:penicillin amidase
MGRDWQTISAISIVILILGFTFAGCTLLGSMPERQNAAQRLRAFPTNDLPLHARAYIYWDRHQIPFIHAADDRDLPLLIGMTHAHLRLAQMEWLRHASQGRLSELLGPLTVDIDHLLRLINFAQAVPAIKAGLPPASLAWLQAYCKGINLYVKLSPSLSPEMAVLAVEPEPWTVEDVLTVGRLITTDINWLFWYTQSRLKGQAAWPQLWERLKAYGQMSLPSFTPPGDLPAQLMLSASKTGSNAFAVSGKRSASGSALMASDPHVGLQLPPLWLIIGYQSPSQRVLGLSIAGQPIVVVGRNDEIAWGGTNMMALSSTFYDLSEVGFRLLHQRQERIKVRWWFDHQVTINESPFGPVVSDSKYFRTKDTTRLALKWRGHASSDEMTAFLKVGRAKHWQAFKEAFETWAVSGQNFLYADRSGNIGQLLAVEWAPAAARAAEAFWGDPRNPRHIWRESLNSSILPSILNPPHGYLVSTNNTPIKTELPLAVADLMQIQANVFSRNSLELAQALVAAAPNAPPQSTALLDALADWDGHYTPDARGAAALELTAYFLAVDYFTAKYGKSIAHALVRSPAVYAFLTGDLRAGEIEDQLPNALVKASRAFEKHDTWDKLHIMSLAHPLGRIPLIGQKFRYGEYSVPGSSNTVYKSAHPLAGERHRVRYGANARFVTDLSDPDENYFALIGGQDGYWNSENYLDLFDLWRQKQYVRVPMSSASVRENAAFQLTFKPSTSLIDQASLGQGQPLVR